MKNAKRVFCASILATAILFLTFCAQKPLTRTYQRQEINHTLLADSLNKPLNINENTAILDARPAFEFALAHFPGALNIQWSDFSNPTAMYPGQLKPDQTEMVRRLALQGVSPDSNVLIIGRGQKGNGEEGRIAWTLLYLGIADVQVAEIDSIGLRYSNIVTQPKKNAKIWTPEIKHGILAEKKEVIKIATSKHDGRSYILDVRSKDEYFSKDKKLKYQMPELRAVHIEWKEFYTAQGRPNPKIIRQLNSIGIKSDDRIIVVSNNGIRSGAVAYALLALRYKNAANFAGGYNELIGKR